MLQSKRLFYKQFLENDFDNYHFLSGNDKVMARIAGKGHTLEKSKEKYKKILETNKAYPEIGMFKVSLQSNNEFLGFAKIEPKDGAYEIGYAMLPQFWGNGYGSEIASKMIGHAKTIERIKSVIAIIDPENIPSKKILLKCGFVLEHCEPWEGLPAENYRLQL